MGIIFLHNDMSVISKRLGELPCKREQDSQNLDINTAFWTQSCKTAVVLLIPSKMHSLLIGIYCFVMTLMASCETIPPVREEMLCNSPPAARALEQKSEVCSASGF
jgi:hypothetical protein